MIYSIKGKLVEKTPSAAVVDTGMIALEAAISVQTFSSLGDTGTDVMLYTHFVMKEDGASLYGFQDLQEKQVFLLLISVSKIGPKSALAILSGMDAEKLKKAITENDVALMQSVPGIGRKTAERIIVELKDKFDMLSISTGTSEGGSDDIASALVNLGFNKNDCIKAVRKVYSADSSFEENLKKALGELSG